MLLLPRKLLHFLLQKTFSSSTAPNWRTQIKQNQTVTQISSILLQRHNWAPLLASNLKLSEPLFHHILIKIQTNPQISINFFNWVKSNFGFQPSPKSLFTLIRISVQSGNYKSAIPIFDSLLQTQPSVDFTIQACRGESIDVLDFIIERYSHKGLILDGLKVFRELRFFGYVPTIHSCNALLDAMERKYEIRLCLCFYCAVIRNGVLPDKLTWSIIARILAKNGKLERIVRLLDLGIYNSVIFNLLIDGYCKKGDFKSALDQFIEMCNKKLNPGFSTYSSILDGACMYGDAKVIEITMNSMIEKGLFFNSSFSSEHDFVIQKLCNSGKTYAAEIFFKRACDEKIELQDATYGCLLRALSKEGRVIEAILVYREISRIDITVSDSVYYAFVNVLCKQEYHSDEATKLLIKLVEKGFIPHASELSKLVTLQCNKSRWSEAENLLNAVMEKGSLPDSICCSSLVKHYCMSGQVDLAIGLHNKMEKVKGSLDVTTYNVLLDGILEEKRVEEAIGVFDYMRTCSMVSSESFSIMISALCCEKELRKAMKLHDEMLKLGLKPDLASYKSLISGFTQ